MSIDEYLQKGIYYIMRKCSSAPQYFGYNSIYELPMPIFRWIIENMSEEFNPDKKEKKGKK